MDPRLEQAIQAIKSGDKNTGLVLLAQVIRADPNNESAWIWMATAQDDPDKKKQSLERVLRINPANERIRRALSVMFPPAAPPAVEKVQEPITAPLPSTPVEPVPSFEMETPEAKPETAQVETAGPDLSWLKETPLASEGPKEEAPDLSWLKEDLHDEALVEGGKTEFETAQPESTESTWLKEELPPAEPEAAKEEVPPDLSWLKEDQSEAVSGESAFTWPEQTKGGEATSDAVWFTEEQPTTPGASPEEAVPSSTTGGADDLSWLRPAASGVAGEIPPAGTETPDFSWLQTEPSTEEKPAFEPVDESAFPWLHEEAAAAEGAAAKNDAESIPDWLRQGAGEEAEPAKTVLSESEARATGSSAGEPAAQEAPTLMSEPLTPDEFDAITSKPAKLPFTWDEVTGEPVVESTSETTAGPTPGEVEVVQPEEAAGAGLADTAQISHPRSAAAAAAPARAAAAATEKPKKGMTTGQIVLLAVLGLATLIVLLAFGFYLAVNFGWLKAFGF
jgi:hypothetical protein